MSQATAPPSPVIWGFARLMQGVSGENVGCETWSEPWKSIGKRVAVANGQRQEVLRECLQQECGDQIESVVRSIFAKDPDGKATDDDSSSPLWDSVIPFHQDKLPVFPIDAFPQWLEDFIEAEAEATQTPPDMAAMMALSVLALAVAKKVEVRVNHGWFEPVNLWTLTTMEPANRKSAVVRDIMEPVVIFQREETRRLAPTIYEAQTRRKMIETRGEFIRGQAAKARKDDADPLMDEAIKLAQELADLQVPVSPKLWTDDCTPEMMGSLLSEHGGRMAVISAEGNIIELMAGRYSKGRPNIGVYLAGHAGDAYTVDRRGRPSEYVPHAAISIGITVQSEVLRSMADKPGFRGCGLLARFLYSYPESRLGQRKSNAQPVPFTVGEQYRRNILTLLALPFETDDDGKPTAHILRLEASAYDLLRDFQEILEPQLSTYGELGFISDWAGKLCGTIARVAGLLHAAEHPVAPWASLISARTMQHAVRIGEYLLAHARAAFREMGQDPVVEDARFIFGWLEQKGMTFFKERDLYQGIKGDSRYKRIEALRPALELLVAHGFIRKRPMERTGPGRTPSPTFDVNPLACSQSRKQPPSSASR